jgi:molybdopterin-guanine dinucleotide biosynthesis protein A
LRLKPLKKSAIILAGGFSKRFGQDKGLVELAGKPLILHVFDRIFHVVNETIVIVSSSEQREAFERLLSCRANIVVEESEPHSPLAGALTGFRNVQSECSLLIPCDTPFISSEIASLLLDLCTNRNAVIPRWPNGYIEPLQAAYRTKPASVAAENALKQNKLDLRSMIANLKGVRYVSTLMLKGIDPELLTFFNINTPEDLKKAEVLIRKARNFSA